MKPLCPTFSFTFWSFFSLTAFLGFHSYVYLAHIIVSVSVLLFSQALLFLLMIPTTFRVVLFTFHIIFWILTHMATACWMTSDDIVIVDSMYLEQKPATLPSGLLLFLGSLVRHLAVTFEPLSLALPLSSQSPNCQIHLPNLSVVSSFLHPQSRNHSQINLISILHCPSGYWGCK